MSSLIKEILFFEDTYVSSKNRNQNEDKFPLLNAGRSENGDVNRILLKTDFSSLTGKIVKAKLCLFQVYYGNRSTAEDKLYLHGVNSAWEEPTATWNTLGQNPIGELVASARFPVEDNVKHCFSVDPEVLKAGGNGFILKGEEDLDKHDRWFHSSEFKAEDGPSLTLHPHLELEMNIHPDVFVLPPNTSNPSESNKSGGIVSGLVIGLSTGILGLALLALLAFMGLRHRRNVHQRRLEEEEYSDESSEEEEKEKDVVDKLGEVFGVITSSDDEDDTLYTRDNETMYTRDVDNSVQSDYYTTNEGIEVHRRYTVREKVQNMLFGVPEEDNTTTTSDEINNYYKNSNRR